MCVCVCVCVCVLCGCALARMSHLPHAEVALRRLPHTHAPPPCRAGAGRGGLGEEPERLGGAGKRVCACARAVVCQRARARAPPPDPTRAHGGRGGVEGRKFDQWSNGTQFDQVLKRAGTDSGRPCRPSREGRRDLTKWSNGTGQTRGRGRPGRPRSNFFSPAKSDFSPSRICNSPTLCPLPGLGFSV